MRKIRKEIEEELGLKYIGIWNDNKIIAAGLNIAIALAWWRWNSWN